MAVFHVFRVLVEVAGGSKFTMLAEFLIVEKDHLARLTANKIRLLEVFLKISSCEESISTEVFPKIPGLKEKFSIYKTVPSEKSLYT